MASRALFAVRVAALVAVLSLCVFMLHVDANSISYGKRIRGDRELIRNNTRVELGRGAQQTKVCYPQRGEKVNITRYEVTDLIPGRGASCQLVSGGVKKTSVCFQLRSAPHQPYNFTVTVFGFRR